VISATISAQPSGRERRRGDSKRVERDRGSLRGDVGGLEWRGNHRVKVDMNGVKGVIEIHKLAL
jgi:hypothetical protein